MEAVERIKKVSVRWEAASTTASIASIGCSVLAAIS